MASRKVMGKGIGVLFSDMDFNDDGENIDIFKDLNEEIDESSIKNIRIRDIEPNKNQPRKNFDKEKLEILSNSIKNHGIVQPILVKKKENSTYMIVAGERRWRAAKMAGLKEIPCIVKDFENDAVMEIALIENLQRENLNPIEEAEGYKSLMSAFGLTQEEVAERVGKSRSAVANSLRLNNLCDEVKKFVIDGKISQGHARAILSITDPKKQTEIANIIIEKVLNVRQVEKMISELGKTKQKKPGKKVSGMMKKYFEEVETSLGSKFGTKVKISEGTGKGKIEIEYYSKEDLERILFELKK